MQVLTSNLFLSTRITRPDANDGEPGELDVIVYFRIESYRPGYPGKFYGEPGDCYPAEPAEYELSFVSAEIDGPMPSDAPLTAAEIGGLEAWFEAHHAEACEVADEQRDDFAANDGAYDRWKDKRMERDFDRAESRFLNAAE